MKICYLLSISWLTACYFSHDEENDRVVALKVIDVDTADYNVNARAKDDTIEATIHEIKVLKQLKDSMAKNVNMFFDAFQIHSQLWIVNDYCPGGSVHTLVSTRLLDLFFSSSSMTILRCTFSQLIGRWTSSICVAIWVLLVTLGLHLSLSRYCHLFVFIRSQFSRVALSTSLERYQDTHGFFVQLLT